MKYSEATRNGVVYKTERTEHGIKEYFALVEPAKDVDVLSGNLEMILNYRGTRCVQVRGLADEKEALKVQTAVEKVATGKKMRIEGDSIEQSGTTGVSFSAIDHEPMVY